jgi:hypothetical protein
MGRPSVGGLRSTARVAADEQPIALPEKRKTFAFCSRAAALRLGLRRRRIMRDPDGFPIEEAPRSKMDNALDEVKFENNYFETDDPELAKAIREKEGFGVGREFWALEDQQKAQDEALERELRARLEARPDIAARVLRPSEASDFALPNPE